MCYGSRQLHCPDEYNEAHRLDGYHNAIGTFEGIMEASCNRHPWVSSDAS